MIRQGLRVVKGISIISNQGALHFTKAVGVITSRSISIKTTCSPRRHGRNAFYASHFSQQQHAQEY